MITREATRFGATSLASDASPAYNVAVSPKANVLKPWPRSG